MTEIQIKITKASGGMMRQVIINPPDEIEQVHLGDVSEDRPIFVKYDGQFVGMVSKDLTGWAIIAGDGGRRVTGHYPDRTDCMMVGSRDGYEFFWG